MLSEPLAEIVRMLSQQKLPEVPEEMLAACGDSDILNLGPVLQTTKLQQAYYSGSNGLSDTPCLLDFEANFQDLDVSRVSTSLKDLVRRHPALRLYILPGGASQEVQDWSLFESWELPVHDLRDAADVEKALSALRQSSKNHSLQDRQWDLQLAILPRQKARLFVRIGLIALDAGSLYHLAKELDLLYGGRALPPLVNDFATAIHRVTRLPFQTPKYTSFPAPPQLPRVAEKREVQRVWGCLDKASWSSLQALCKRENLTPTAAITCCFQDVLRRRLGRHKEFTLNMTTTSRHRVAASSSDLVGDFTNCQLIGCRLGPVTFVDRARAIQRQIDAYLAEPFCGIQQQEEARRLVQASNLAHTSFYDVVVTSLLGYESWTPEHMPFTGLEKAVTQTPQVVLDFQLLEQASELLLSFDVAPVVPIRWAEAVMQGTEAHLHGVVAQSMKGQVLPSNPRRSHEPFASQTPFTRLDAELQRAAAEHGNRVAVATGHEMKELSYGRRVVLARCG